MRLATSVTLSGNLTSDVTLRHTAGGPVANFRLASSERWLDRRTDQWMERVVYLNVSCWRRLAEHVAASLALGQPVVVVGRLRQRQYDKDGQTHTVVEVDADLVGHDLTRGTAAFVRAPKGPQTADVADPSHGASAGEVVVERAGAAA